MNARGRQKLVLYVLQPVLVCSFNLLSVRIYDDILFELEVTTSASVTSNPLGSNLLHLYPHSCILQLAIAPATLQQLSAQQHFHISLVDMCLCHQY